MQTAYAHDDGLYVALKHGKILLAGGHKENLGIGQTFEAETYDATTHTVGRYGCLDCRRTLASGTETDSGRVVISGNWYAADGIEIFDDETGFSYVKPVSVGRALPFMLRTSHDDVLILGSMGTHGENLGDSMAIVDRLHGEPFTVPLLQKWNPVGFAIPPHYSNDGFIGRVPAPLGTGEVYAHLLLARDSLAYGQYPAGQARHPSAILLVRDTLFSLLPTVCPIPCETSVGGPIWWYGPLVADSHARRAYVPGVDKDNRLYVFAVDCAPLFNSGSALNTLVYYTDPLPDCGFNTPILTDDGDLAIIGGNYKPGFISENYTPTSSVYILRLHDHNPSAATHAQSRLLWLVALLFLVAVAATAFLLHKKRFSPARSAQDAAGNETSDSSLFNRLCDIMDKQQLFRNPELKLSDVAAALGTNTRYVADSIKKGSGQTFSQFVNGYRINYAKRLIRQSPNKTIIEIYTDAGFSSERSFFRTFKEATGMTTREWLSQQTK